MIRMKFRLTLRNIEHITVGDLRGVAEKLREYGAVKGDDLNGDWHVTIDVQEGPNDYYDVWEARGIYDEIQDHLRSIPVEYVDLPEWPVSVIQ